MCLRWQQLLSSTEGDLGSELKNPGLTIESHPVGMAEPAGINQLST